MEFMLDIVPPTVTAQERRVRVVHGKPMFYETSRLKVARELFTGRLMEHTPVKPMEGPLLLYTSWYFLTKTHKESEFRSTKPDTDNLQKLLKDCMTAAGIWRDDAQVCVEIVAKRWTRRKPGIWIQVVSLGDR